jgi:hypothetical protein
VAELILESTSTAQWHRLVTEASAVTGARLDEDTECYLVFLLMRYLRRPDLLRRVMARGYLRAMLAEGQVRRQRLRDVGDQCLILAGMFPGQARRRRVDLKYFVDLGRGAYGRLGQMPESAAGELYGELAEAFTELMDVLHALRMTDRRGDMALLDAVERYWDTGSPAARRQLERSGRIVPMPLQDRRH